MANYYRYFAIAVRLHGKLADAWTRDTLNGRRKAWQQLVDAGEDDVADEIGIDFDWAIEDGCLHLTDNGDSGNVAHVAKVLRELIALGYVQEPVAIHWADTCSSPRPDSFSGGAALVTRRRTYWFDLNEIIEKKIGALERRRPRGSST